LGTCQVPDRARVTPRTERDVSTGRTRGIPPPERPKERQMYIGLGTALIILIILLIIFL
jgi:hypothetical protein